MERINERKSTARVLGEVYTFDWRAPQGAEGLLEKSSHLVVASQLCGPQPTKKKCSQLGGKKIKQNRNLTIAGVSLQGLREIVRSCLLQLQSLPLVCKYPAVLSLTPSLLSRTHTHFKSIAAHSLPASATSEGCPIYIVAWGVKHFRVHAQADMLSRWKRLSFHTLPVFEAFPSQAMKWDIVWCQTFSLCECVTEAAAWCNHIVLCFYIQICKCALAGRCESVTWKMLFSSLIQDC